MVLIFKRLYLYQSPTYKAMTLKSFTKGLRDVIIVLAVFGIFTVCCGTARKEKSKEIKNTKFIRI